MTRLLLFALFCVRFCTASTPFLNIYLTGEDRDNFKAFFTSTLADSESDLSAIHHSIGGLNLIGHNIPANEVQKYCKKAKLADVSSAKELYHAASIVSLLNSCSLSFAKAAATLEAVAKHEKTTTQIIYYALSAAELLKINVDQNSFDNALKNALKRDDGANSLAYGLNAAVFLDANKMKTYFDRIEDLVGQADEVDGKYLQLEGGLSITSTGIYGIYALADKLAKSPAVKSDESVKFANYLLSRKGVRMERAAYILLRALKKLANNKYQVPVAFNLASPVAVDSTAPKVVVRLCNVIGETVGPLTVNVDSGTHLASSGVVLSRKQMIKSQNDDSNTLYELNFMEQPRERGFYKLTLSAGSQDKRLIGTNGAGITIKVLTDVIVEDVEMAVYDREHNQATKTHKIATFTKLSSALEADIHQKLTIKFAVREKRTKKEIVVHQAFVTFVHSKSKQEIVFIAEPDPATSIYKFDVDLQKAAKDFDNLSGKYHVHLIVGDSVITNAIYWILADVNLKLPPHEAKKVKKSEIVNYEKLPEISHLFRKPEKQPPKIVSQTFTFICLAPILILFVLWLKIGINFGNFQFSLWTLGFYIGLTGIFVLYFMFWLKLNMFVTLKYLVGVGGVAFICGNRMLRAMADSRKRKTE